MGKPLKMKAAESLPPLPDNELVKYMRHARETAISYLPYTRELFFLIPTLWDDSIDTACFAGDNTFRFNRWFVSAMIRNKGPLEVAGVYVHEIGHAMFRHIPRVERIMEIELGRFNEKVSGMAADCSINPMLARVCGDLADSNLKYIRPIQLPDTQVLPSQFGLKEGLSYEEYYHLLKNHPDLQQDSEGEGDESEGEGDGSGDGDGEGQGRESDKSGKSSRPNPGQGCGPVRKKPSPQPGSSEEPGTVRDIEGRVHKVAPNIRVNNAVRNVMRKLSDHAHGRGLGALGELQALNLSFEPPKVPWQEVLRNRLYDAVSRSAGITERDSSKYSRRQHGIGIGPGTPIMVARYDVKPSIAVMLDTSGSMWGSQNRTASEMKAIIEEVGAGGELHIVSSDTNIYDIGAITSADQLGKAYVGGGGTDLGAACAYAVKKYNPSVLVAITDGYIGARGLGEDNGKPVVVCLTTTYQQDVQYVEDEGFGNIVTCVSEEEKGEQ